MTGFDLRYLRRSQLAVVELKNVVDTATALKGFGLDAEETLKSAADLAAYMGVDIVEASQAMGRAFAGGGGGGVDREPGRPGFRCGGGCRCLGGVTRSILDRPKTSADTRHCISFNESCKVDTSGSFNPSWCRTDWSSSMDITGTGCR